MSEYSWAWGGGRSSSRTSNSRASTINQRRGEVSHSANYDYEGTGLPDDRSPGTGTNTYLPTRRNVSAWNEYVGASRRLEELTRAAISNGIARYSYNNQYVEWDRQADLNTARNMRATIQTYRDNQEACTGGDQGACDAVGRRNAQDRAYYNPNQASYRNYFLHANRENPTASRPEEPAPPAETPGDIMGGGETISPEDANTEENKRARCENSGGRYTSDGGGSCFHDAPPLPAPPAQDPDPAPQDAPHTDEPAERTGDQVPDCPQGGRRNLLGILDSHCHNRQVNPTAQGGGSHSGEDGSATMAGSGEVEHFDTGGKQKTLARQANPVREMINLISALEDPYGQFRKCNTEKRLVE